MDLKLGINGEPGTQGRNKTHQNIDGISQRCQMFSFHYAHWAEPQYHRISL